MPVVRIELTTSAFLLSFPKGVRSHNDLMSAALFLGRFLWALSFPKNVLPLSHTGVSSIWGRGIKMGP